MVREIITYPNKILKQKSILVTKFNKEIHALLDDMYETMVAKNGIGLAAIQIAIPKRVMVINIPIENEKEDPQPRKNTLEIINPLFIEKKGSVKYQEGCLSIPSYYDDITRFSYVKLQYQDRYGKEHILEDDNFLAVALQHEYDHLEGHLFIEKLSILKRKKFEKEWKKRSNKNKT